MQNFFSLFGVFILCALGAGNESTPSSNFPEEEVRERLNCEEPLFVGFSREGIRFSCIEGVPESWKRFDISISANERYRFCVGDGEVGEDYFLNEIFFRGFQEIGVWVDQEGVVLFGDQTIEDPRWDIDLPFVGKEMCFMYEPPD